MALPSSLGRLPSFTNAPGAGGFDKLQNSPFGSGSLTAGLSQRIQQSGGLGETRGIPVGRSTMDPERALGMLSRGTARPGQVQAALGMENLQRQRRQDERQDTLFQQEQQRIDLLKKAYEQMSGGQPPTTGANPPATGGNAPPPPTAGGSAAPTPTAPPVAGANSAAPNAVADAFGKMFGDVLLAGAEMRTGNSKDSAKDKADYARYAFDHVGRHRKSMTPEMNKTFDEYFADTFSSLYPTNE